MLLFFKTEFIKGSVFKRSLPTITQSFYTIIHIDFMFLIDFAWKTPKNIKLSIITPKTYDDHPLSSKYREVPPRGFKV